MAFRCPDMVKAVATTTGTGPISGWSPSVGFRDLAAAVAAGHLASGDKIPYTLKQGSGTQWEQGLGTISISGGVITMTRSVRRSTEAANAPLNLVGAAEFIVDIGSEDFYGLQTPIGQLGQFSAVPDATWLPAQGGTYLQADYPQLFASMGHLNLTSLNLTASGGLASGAASLYMNGYNPDLGLWLSGAATDDYDGNGDWIGVRYHAYKQTTRGGAAVAIGSQGGFGTHSTGGRPWAHSPTHSCILINNAQYALAVTATALASFTPTNGYYAAPVIGYGNGRFAACNPNSTAAAGAGGGKIYHWQLGNPASATPTVPATAATIVGTFPGSVQGVFFNAVAGKFVIPGRDSSFWTSTDAIGLWVEEVASPFGGATPSDFAVLDDGTYAISFSGGSYPGIWTSADLINWKRIYAANCAGLIALGRNGLGLASLTRPGSGTEFCLFNKNAEAGRGLVGINSSAVYGLQKDPLGWVGYNGSQSTLYTPTINLDTQFSMPTYTTVPTSYVKASN